MITDRVHLGHIAYTFKRIRKNGDIELLETVKNLIPTPARYYMAGRIWGSTAQITAWYLGLIGAAGYTPAYTDTPTFLAANGAEITDYGTQRIALTASLTDDLWATASGTPISFTAQNGFTAYGAFIASTQAFSSTTGTLLSEVMMSSPKTFAAGEILQVSTAIQLAT